MPREESASPRKVPAVMEQKGRVPAKRPGETNTWRPRRTVSALEEGGLGGERCLLERDVCWGEMSAGGVEPVPTYTYGTYRGTRLQRGK